MCGFSDIIDGYLARRYKWETRFGEQLDSLSDTVFYGVMIYLLIAYTDMIDNQWAIIGIAIINNTILFIPGLILCFIALASSIEEMIILLTSKQYNGNRKSIFIR